jgi:hypothetical protein
LLVGIETMGRPDKSEFTRAELAIIRRYRTPNQVQKFVRTLKYNQEKEETSCLSFRGVIRKGHAHCLEAAIVAAVILEQYGFPPILVSIESQDKLDHVLFLFKQNGRFGAIARSRDLGLHGRRPVFRTVRDLVMSYFDPYVDKSGRIVGYATANLYELGNYDWRLSKQNVWKVERYLQEIPHKEIHGSDKRYERNLKRYLLFHEQYPDRSPDYFSTKPLWLS